MVSFMRRRVSYKTRLDAECINGQLIIPKNTMLDVVLLILLVFNIALSAATGLSPVVNIDSTKRVNRFLEAKIASNDDELRDLKLSIAAAQVEINNVLEMIIEVEKQLKTAPDQEKDYLRRKECSLRKVQELTIENLLILRRREEKLLDADYHRSLATEMSLLIPTNKRVKFEAVSASHFTASEGKHCISCLFNGARATSFNLPDVVQRFIKTEVPEVAVRRAEISACRGIPQTMFPVQVPEIGKEQYAMDSTVEIELQDYFTCHDNPKLVVASKKTLSYFGANLGPADGTSAPGGTVYTVIDCRNIPMSCFELKDIVTAPIQQVGQAFASGANIALRQKRYGLDSSDIAVPLIMTNGQLYSFGTATLLDNIPVLHLVTDVLDANRLSDLFQIAHLLAKIKAFITSQAKLLQQCVLPDNILKAPSSFPFDDEKYFIKYKNQIYNRFKPLNEENGALPLQWQIFEALAQVEEGEKPLGYGDFNWRGKTPCLVFRNIRRDGYVMGVPVDEEDFKCFTAALESVVHRIHANGVIHVDLHPSNILWLKVDGSIKIRIVDWDAATFAAQPFTPSMLERLKVDPDLVYHEQSALASPKHDAWFVFILESLSKTDREIMRDAVEPSEVIAVFTEPSEVIAVFTELIRDRVEKYGSAVAMREAFLKWFEGFEARGAAAALPPGARAAFVVENTV